MCKQSQERLEIHLEHKLQRPRVSLHVRDSPERAPRLLHQIRLAVRTRGQTEVRVGIAQILMIKRLERLPSKLDVPSLSQMEVLH